MLKTRIIYLRSLSSQTAKEQIDFFVQKEEEQNGCQDRTGSHRNRRNHRASRHLCEYNRFIQPILFLLLCKHCHKLLDHHVDSSEVVGTLRSEVQKRMREMFKVTDVDPFVTTEIYKYKRDFFKGYLCLHFDNKQCGWCFVTGGIG